MISNKTLCVLALLSALTIQATPKAHSKKEGRQSTAHKKSQVGPHRRNIQGYDLKKMEARMNAHAAKAARDGKTLSPEFQTVHANMKQGKYHHEKEIMDVVAHEVIMNFRDQNMQRNKKNPFKKSATH